MVYVLIGIMIVVIIAVIYFDRTNKVETIDVDLFTVPSKLKFEKTWFSGDYVTPYFYHRGRWHSMKAVGKPIWGLEDNWIEDTTYQLKSNSDFSSEKMKWSTVGVCLEHNKNIEKKVRENNISLAKQRKEIRDGKDKALRRANE